MKTIGLEQNDIYVDEYNNIGVKDYWKNKNKKVFTFFHF